MPKKIIFAVFLFIVFCLTVAIVFFYGSYKKIKVDSSAKPVAIAPTSPNDPHANDFHHFEPYGLLLLGYGGGAHEGGHLTDTMMMVYIDPPKQRTYLISVPRDLWVPIATDAQNPKHMKINSAYPVGLDDRMFPHKPTQFTGPAGGGELAKSTVETVTGLHMNNFIALDFAGFKKSIDVLGGVNVRVEKTFDDDQYPIEGKEDDTCGKSPEELQRISTLSATLAEPQFACRYETIHFDRGIVHMDGETALKFVRSRHSKQDGTDFGRAARQRNLLLAVRDKIFTLDFFPKIIPFISTLTNNLQTDLSIADMEQFLKFKSDLSAYKITTLALTDQNVLVQTRSPDRQDVLMPKAGMDNWSEIHTWIQDSLNASESAEVTPVPQSAAAAKGKFIIKTASGSAQVQTTSTPALSTSSANIKK